MKAKKTIMTILSRKQKELKTKRIENDSNHNNVFQFLLLFQQWWTLLKFSTFFSCQESVLKHNTQVKRSNNKHNHKDSSFLMKKGHHNVQAKSNSVCFGCFFCNDSKKKSSAWFQNAILSPIFFDSSSGLCETPLEILQVTCVHRTHQHFCPKKWARIDTAQMWRHSCVKAKENGFSTQQQMEEKDFVCLVICEDISALRELFTQHNKTERNSNITQSQRKRKRIIFLALVIGRKKHCFCFDTEISSHLFEYFWVHLFCFAKLTIWKKSGTKIWTKIKILSLCSWKWRPCVTSQQAGSGRKYSFVFARSLDIHQSPTLCLNGNKLTHQKPPFVLNALCDAT